MATGIRDCGYRHTMGTDTGVHSGVHVNFFMRCTVYIQSPLLELLWSVLPVLGLMLCCSR